MILHGINVNIGKMSIFTDVYVDLLYEIKR